MSKILLLCIEVCNGLYVFACTNICMVGTGICLCVSVGICVSKCVSLYVSVHLSVCAGLYGFVCGC